MQEGLTWQALQWPDGTRYEGLTKNGQLHSHGVLTFPNKDRYEGQFEAGQMHGAGVYVWSSGTMYRGDWTRGMMHGCGTTLSKQDGTIAGAEGKYFGSEFVGDVMPCSRTNGYEAAVEADMAAYQARSFKQWRQPQPVSGQQQRMHTPPSTLQGTPSGRPPQDQGPPLDAGSILDAQQQVKLQGLLQHLASQPRPNQRSTETQKHNGTWQGSGNSA